jgi:iron uptake system EfeUOB component EfeO/EfeM
MNNPKLLYAQYKLALTAVDPRLQKPIKAYFEHLISVIDKYKEEESRIELNKWLKEHNIPEPT